MALPQAAQKLDYELPKTVAAVRDGWQWTCSSGAVVSGLLAASAAQLLSLFKGNPPASNLVIGLCYAAIFLNISATIGSFVITDSLGDVAYRSSRRSQQLASISNFDGTQSRLLTTFGVGSCWDVMLWHWLITFYCGIFSLILAVAIYVWQHETKGISIAMTIVISLTVVPVITFILLGIKADQL
jgi:hypothetical protein